MFLWQHTQFQIAIMQEWLPLYLILSKHCPLPNKRLIRRASAIIWALHMLKMGWIISPYTVKQAAFDLHQKETGSKSVAIATSKYASRGAFLVYNVLAKFQLFCIITCRDILYFVFWLPFVTSQLWHHQYLICIIQKSWISLERDEIWQKGKCHSSSLLKVFQISLFFNSSIFHFIGALIELWSYDSIYINTRHFQAIVYRLMAITQSLFWNNIAPDRTYFLQISSSLNTSLAACWRNSLMVLYSFCHSSWACCFKDWSLSLK